MAEKLLLDLIPMELDLILQQKLEMVIRHLKVFQVQDFQVEFRIQVYRVVRLETAPAVSRIELRLLVLQI
jgi:hypothetical protein